MRLIDADAFLEKMKRTSRYFDVKFDIEEMPTIDAVPVVRCWYCGNGMRCVDGYVRCSHPSGKVILMKSSDFCSYGERKEGAD